MHRQDDAGNDWDGQRDAGEDAEIPEVVEVTRHRIAAADRIEHEAGKREPIVHPPHEAVARPIFFRPGNAHLLLLPHIWTTVSDANAYSGTSSLVGAGPFRSEVRRVGKEGDGTRKRRWGAAK